LSSLTVIIPAYNEAGNIAETLAAVVPFIEKYFQDYEILVFDDCSKDDTGKIAESVAAQNPKIKVIHNPKNMGMGYNYKAGVKMARKDYVVMVPGDNDILEKTFDPLFQAVGEKDIILAYTADMSMRPWGRVILSKTFTGLMNLLFGLRLKYFNGIVVHRTDLVRSIAIETDSFAYQAEALVKLLRKGASYLELPQYIRERRYGSSKALGLRNIARVLKTIFRLWFKTFIDGKPVSSNIKM